MDGDVGELEPWHARESGPGGRRDVDKKKTGFTVVVLLLSKARRATRQRGARALGGLGMKEDQIMDVEGRAHSVAGCLGQQSSLDCA